MQQQQHRGREQQPVPGARRRRRQRASAGRSRSSERRARPPVTAPASAEAPVAAASPPAAAPVPAATRPPAPEPRAAAVKLPSGSMGACPVCDKSVENLYTAIACGEDGLPAHFDCILSMLSGREELSVGERVCYLGGGSFGVIQVRSTGRQRDRRSSGGLFIRKRIEFEKVNSPPEWRQALRFAPVRPH